MKGVILAGMFTCVLVSCSYTDPTQFTTTVSNENRDHIKDAVIVPVVKVSKRLSFGPDGKGMASDPGGVVLKPFQTRKGCPSFLVFKLKRSI